MGTNEQSLTEHYSGDSQTLVALAPEPLGAHTHTQK